MNRGKIDNCEPSVSWLICANREDVLLYRAVNSCLSQTLTDFELLLIVNGPDVNRLASSLSLKFAADERVKVIGTSIHLLNFSLSLGIHHARAPFIARMDTDDIAAPERLETQLAYMRSHDDVAVLGSAYFLIDEHSNVKGKVEVPESDFSIRRALRFGNPICHPSVMLRRDAITAEGGYLGGKNAEDYDLWLRISMSKKWRFANLSTPLLSYNISPEGQARHSRAAYANVAGAQYRQFLLTRDIRWLLGASLSAGKSFFVAKRP